MNNTQALVVALCICVVGAGFIYLGVRIVISYSQFFRRDPQRSLAWDALSTILAGSWSAPVILAGLILGIGSVALFVGASIGIYILWFEISRALA